MPASSGSRERPGVVETPPADPFPDASALGRADAEQAELERLEAILDERKQLEAALREWEEKGF